MKHHNDLKEFKRCHRFCVKTNGFWKHKPYGNDGFLINGRAL